MATQRKDISPNYLNIISFFSANYKVLDILPEYCYPYGLKTAFQG
jgi:hypothetical protein